MEPMQVIIKEREVEYISDYPEGWKFSAGDPFKFPVLIGNYMCFIKRFEQKSPEEISGWELLIKMKGKYDRNLSSVYDIKNVQEDDKEIYYVFYEYLDGITFDKYIQQPDINLIHLNSDLFSAIRALQKYEFWFADFCEKNIFCQKDGTFVLVDVDSTQHTSDLPDNEMYGSKDYWILVFKFFKEVLKKNDIRLADINGISLNYLQIPFLVLRLKLFMASDKKDYNSTELFNKLPSQLIEMAPEFRQIYLNVIKNGIQPLSEKEISTIKEVVERRIIRTDDIPEIVIAPVSLPVIKAFTTSSSTIESGGAFTLSWQVENANKLELYKNGARFKTLDVGEKAIALTGFADGTRQQSTYQLYAYKELALAKSDPIIIKLKESALGAIIPKVSTITNKVSNMAKKVNFIILGALVLAVALFFIIKNISARNKAVHIKESGLYEDSIITIYGKKLPDISTVHVYFNNMESDKKYYSNDSVVVHVPDIKDTTSSNTVTAQLSVKSAGKELYYQLFPYIKSLYTINLTDSAPVARWQRGVLADANNLTASNDVQPAWPGSIANDHGSAVTTFVTMENSQPYNVLWTHPWWFPNGTIKGFFPWCNLRGKKTFKAQVGFVKDSVTGQKSTDGATFQVWLHYRPDSVEKQAMIFSQHKDYDNTLLNISVDFPPDTSDDFFVELRVDAGNSPNVDWAAWINPIVISRVSRSSTME